MPETFPNNERDTTRRRSTRIVQAVPLTVTGVDALGRPFQERTSSLLISCHGCRYQSKHYVLKNMWVTLEVPHPEPGREPRRVRGRVTWIQRPRTVRELFQVGVELEVAGNFWGIAFPPEDWFPFPESLGPEIPAPGEAGEAAQAEWPLPEAPAVEDNVRVMPTPGGDEGLAAARHMARLLVEARQQIQQAAREAAAKAVESEAQPLLAAIQNQLQQSARLAVEAAAAPHAERLAQEAAARLEEARQASAASLREELQRELARMRDAEAAQFAEGLKQAGQAQGAAHAEALEARAHAAIGQLEGLSTELNARVSAVRGQVEELKRELEAAAAAQKRAWQEAADGRAKDAQQRLEKFERAAKSLAAEVEEATKAAQSGWRARLDADLGSMSGRWTEKVEGALEGAAREAAERLAKNSQASAAQLEQQLTTRIGALRGSFEHAIAESESALGTLRGAIAKESARARTAASELEKSVGKLEERRTAFDALAQTATIELEKRFEELLNAQSAELNRRAAEAMGGMAERFQPVFEQAGRKSLERLAGELEAQVAPKIEQAREVLRALETNSGATADALRAYTEKLREAAEQSARDFGERLAGAAQVHEKEFQEAGRGALEKLLSELESRGTDAQHSTFEAIFKTAEWYEKKVQAQMQSVVEKGLEQATNSLREKAGEISRVFASELDHYSRSYVEHAQGQMDETLKEAEERARGALLQSADATAGKFVDQLHESAQREHERFASALAAGMQQAVARMETNARQFVTEFQRGLGEEIRAGIARARQDLGEERRVASESLRSEAESHQRGLRESLAQAGEDALEAYKQRLENVSNSWILATVTSLGQQSQTLVQTLTQSAESRLRETCSEVFAGMGETLRLRMLDLSQKLSEPPTEEKK